MAFMAEPAKQQRQQLEEGNGRASVMPQWKGRLDENTIRQLTVYVHSLGGGEESEPVNEPALYGPGTAE